MIDSKEPDHIRLAPCVVCGKPCEFNSWQGEHYCPKHTGEPTKEDLEWAEWEGWSFD